jgi:hypothetical protein
LFQVMAAAWAEAAEKPTVAMLIRRSAADRELGRMVGRVVEAISRFLANKCTEFGRDVNRSRRFVDVQSTGVPTSLSASLKNHPVSSARHTELDRCVNKRITPDCDRAN